ncbi:MAG: site-specific DNA-methyltransferase, partial [Neisseriaceae bacterium]|nr:site-specific DNA-methyltransferase [Neisseriaceae bacterium]
INQAQKTTGYPTEKNFEMLKMIVSASSNPGDIVLDCFAGSGTTLGAAFECGRLWIGADNSIESIKAILKRFTSGLDIYGDYVSAPTENRQMAIELDDRCPFTVFATKELKPDIEEICGSVTEAEYVKISNA